MGIMQGTIKEVRTVDGQHIVVVEVLSPGPAVTATVMQSACSDFCPVPGDRAVVARAGAEMVVLALFSEDVVSGLGEWLTFSRNAAGVVMATFHMKADGEISMVNSLGSGVLKPTGQWDFNNGNLTVEP